MHGPAKSAENNIGNKYGELTIISVVRGTNVKYICECTCGNITPPLLHGTIKKRKCCSQKIKIHRTNALPNSKSEIFNRDELLKIGNEHGYVLLDNTQSANKHDTLQWKHIPCDTIIGKSVNAIKKYSKQCNYCVSAKAFDKVISILRKHNITLLNDANKLTDLLDKTAHLLCSNGHTFTLTYNGIKNIHTRSSSEICPFCKTDNLHVQHIKTIKDLADATNYTLLSISNKKTGKLKNKIVSVQCNVCKSTKTFQAGSLDSAFRYHDKHECCINLGIYERIMCKYV